MRHALDKALALASTLPDSAVSAVLWEAQVVFGLQRATTPAGLNGASRTGLHIGGAFYTCD